MQFGAKTAKMRPKVRDSDGLPRHRPERIRRREARMPLILGRRRLLGRRVGPRSPPLRKFFAEADSVHEAIFRRVCKFL